jgi:hypothetical protein
MVGPGVITALLVFAIALVVLGLFAARRRRGLAIGLYGLAFLIMTFVVALVVAIFLAIRDL